jgi:hypothetical protein
MYVGLGTLSESQKTEIGAMLPSWFSREFEECWVKGTNLDYPHCRDLDAVYQKLDQKDRDEMDELVSKNTQILSEKQVLTYGLLIAGAGLALGMIVGVSMAR